jgi:hypothetical protein
METDRDSEDTVRVALERKPESKWLGFRRFLLFKPIAKMLALVFLSLLSAIGQHFLYTYVDGQRPDQFFIQQIWVIRVGTALAFLAKTAAVAGVGIAFTQRSWFSFRRKAISVDGLDDIFGVLQNPLRFYSKDLFSKSKGVALLGLSSWLLPLSAIFSLGSLTGFSLHCIVDDSCNCDADFL